LKSSGKYTAQPYQLSSGWTLRFVRVAKTSSRICERAELNKQSLSSLPGSYGSSLQEAAGIANE
jgi:hypothetical protein